MSPFDSVEWLWMNGKIIPWKEGTIHVSTHALHYGSGVFEGIRCYETAEGPAVFRLKEHLDRLFHSASPYGIEIPYTPEELASAVFQLIGRNHFSSCYIRPICYYGSGNLGVNPRACPVDVAILAWPWGAYLGAHGLEEGVRLTVSPWKRFHYSMIPTTAKGCGGYLNSLLSVRDAVRRGFDEAVMLDMNGNLAEGSGENLFLIRNNTLFTNDEKSSILLGITRDSVMAIARDLGYSVQIGVMKLEDLLSAEEAFFTGTAAEVTPIREVDGKMIGQGKRGPVTRSIQEKFFAIVKGEEPKYRHWLSFVGKLRETSSPAKKP